MARRRKQTHDSRQLSLFDIMANQIEEIREENIQDDMREAAQAASSPGGEQRPENAIPVSERQSIQEDRQPAPSRDWFELLGNSPKTMTPLGLNGRGETVYEMENGVRMYSRNPEFMQTVDGDGSTPEELFLQNNHNFLTVQEVAAFRQQHSLSLERQHAGQAATPEAALEKKAAGQPEPAREEKPFPFPTNDGDKRRLGVNGKGDSVYELQDGSRMYSSNPDIMQVVDGNKRSPEKLFEDGADDYLTVQEISHFTQTLPWEVQHARQTNLSARNRKKGSQARNNQRRAKRGIHQFGLFDTGSLGAEQPRRAEEAGGDGDAGFIGDSGSTVNHREQSPQQRDGTAGEPAGDVGFGDIGEHGHRHEPENYRITSEDRLGVGGAKTKYADNIAAIRLLKQLQANNAELATPEEQKVLVRYVGWGGLPQVFDAKNEQWAAEYRELQGLLSPEDYAAARRSTQDAHYTSETAIRGIYQGLSRIGLGNGGKLRILEPSAGIGNFIGLCPEHFNANFLAVELDTSTSAIAKYLYPKARHINNGFQHTNIKSTIFDAVIGTPPSAASHCMTRISLSCGNSPSTIIFLPSPSACCAKAASRPLWSAVISWMPPTPRPVSILRGRPTCLALSACRKQPFVRMPSPMSRPTFCFFSGMTAKTNAAETG